MGDRPIISFIAVVVLALSIVSFASANDLKASQVMPINDNGWVPITNPETGEGGAVCYDDTQNYACFMLRCRKGEPLEYAYYFTGGDLPGTTIFQLIVDGVGVDTLRFEAVDPNGHLRAPLGSNAANVIETLKQGAQMAVVSGGKMQHFSLRGSRKQIDRAQRLCKMPNPLALSNQDDSSVNSIISGVFKSNECIASENQIFHALSGEIGLAAANSKFVMWTERVDFLERYKVISSDPYIYKDVSSSFCKSKGTNEQKKLGSEASASVNLTVRSDGRARPTRSSSAAFDIIAHEVDSACDGAPGKFNPVRRILQDLTGDQIEDMIVQHDAITCKGGKRSLFCGAQVCSIKIFVGQSDGEYKEFHEVLGIVDRVTTEFIPNIKLFGHGGRSYTLRWNGKEFK